VAAVEVGVVGLGAAVPGDLVVDVPLEARLVALDRDRVVRFPAAVFFRPGDVFRGFPLGVGRVLCRPADYVALSLGWPRLRRSREFVVPAEPT
jgi:hypothetical protein